MGPLYDREWEGAGGQLAVGTTVEAEVSRLQAELGRNHDPARVAGLAHENEEAFRIERIEVHSVSSGHIQARQRQIPRVHDVSSPRDPGVTIVPVEAFALRPDLDGVSFEALGNDQNYRESSHDQNGETDFRFRYVLRSHATPYDQAAAVAWSRSVAAPLLAAAGRLPRVPLPGVSVDPRRALVTAWKPADGAGLILRLWETSGQSVALSVRLQGFRSAAATDLLERDLHALPMASSQVSVDLRAHGFAAIRLQRSPGAARPVLSH